MKEKKGPPKGDYNSPWRLHIGIFWKLHFTTFSKRLRLANLEGEKTVVAFVCYSS